MSDAVAPARVDVAIVGAGIVGASVAYWLTRLQPGLAVALVERDPGFAQASSQRSASSIRQQFSSPVNIRMSQFGLQFLRDAPALLEVDGEAPAIGLTLPGYLCLAGAEQAAARARTTRCGARAGRRHRAARAHRARRALRVAQGRRPGAGRARRRLRRLVRRAGAACGDAASRPRAGARLLRAEAVAIECASTGAARRATALRLADGTRLACGWTVLAAGAWSRPLAASAGIELPVHARRRTVFVLSCPTPLPGCPLVVDADGWWFRPEGRAFIGGTTPQTDTDDLPLEPDLAEFDERLWAALAHRVPAFEALRVERAWAGYYEMNLWDHNALLGEHPAVERLLLAVGFSGHGMQQAPAAGRGIAEWVLHGGWRSLDLSALSTARLVDGRRLVEANVIG